MRLHLVDTNKKRDEFYDVVDDASYDEVWDDIDGIVDKFNYGIEGYPIPKIDKEKRLVEVHWVELFGTLSKPYIEIVDASDEFFKCLDNAIARKRELDKYRRKVLEASNE